MIIEKFVFHTSNTHPDNGEEFVRYEDVQKRIAELDKIIDLDTERFRELGEEIQELKKRIAELEEEIRKTHAMYINAEAEGGANE